MAKRLMAVCAAVGLSIAAADAQNATGLVVAACGTPQAAFVAGRPGPFTVDTKGQLCLDSTGSPAGGTPTGYGNRTGLVVTTCGSPPTAFKAGNPGPFTVNTSGGMCE